MRRCMLLAACWAMALMATSALAEEKALHSFKRQQLTDVYYSEGANAGDLNGDGIADVVYGPYWFEGPKYEVKHELYPVKPQPREAYADNFFNWIYDFNKDGAGDVFVVGFPGTPAYVYENPKSADPNAAWKKHEVFPSVANESPHFVNLVGDERPELVCTFEGAYGFATVDWDKPFGAWKFHRVSDQSAPDRFGHGLGVGDINGDGKNDIIMAGGWFEQPAEGALTTAWKFHPVQFTNAYGGAEMYAYDVDGDGDNDVITSLAAHDFGLAWYEQDRSGAEPVFRQHLIMGNTPAQNRYGVVFSEPHSVALADIDGDGLKDIITGKTYYSHHKGSPMWDAGAVVYWFKLVRGDKGVDWVPYKADDKAGIGRQISIVDVNGDKLPDIVVGGMLGAHVLTHQKTPVSDADWQKAQPKPVEQVEQKTTRGERPTINDKTGRVDGALEAEKLKVLATSAGKTLVQGMSGFNKDSWSGAEQLFWLGAKPGDRLELELPVDKAGKYDVLGAFTMAPDYAIVGVEIDDEKVGQAIDLFSGPDVVNSGEIKLAERELAAGPHKLVLRIAGANPAAVASYMVGLDYLRLRPAGAKPAK